MGVRDGTEQGGCVAEAREKGNEEIMIEEEGETTKSVGPKQAEVGGSVRCFKIPESRPRSGSESSASVVDPGRLWRKAKGVKRRRLNKDGMMSTDEEMSETPEPKSVGHPSKYLGMAKNKADLARRRREEAAEKVEEELYRDSLVAEFRRETYPSATSDTSAEGSEARPTANKSLVEIKKQVAGNVETILKVATKSGHLKGTFVRALKEAATSIKEVVEVLSTRTISEETQQLQADNARLQSEMASLRKELDVIKEDMERARKKDTMPSPPDKTKERPHVSQRPSKNTEQYRANNNLAASPMEEICRSVMVQVGEMLNARLASFEDRLLPEKRLRPLLAADTRKTAQTEASVSAQTHVPRPRRSEETTTLPATSSTRPTANEGLWERVEGRKKKKKKKKKDKNPQHNVTFSRPQSQPRPQTQTRLSNDMRRLRPPRSAAVVISLQPGAEEKGATYAAVLGEAKKRIALSSLGIDAVRFKVAASGGRILEFPGASGSEKADCLALKLREVIGEELVRVYRPTKCVDLRISGLDDSVTSGDVVAAVAQMGGCPIDQVRYGEITVDYSGLGTMWLRCPVVAAKKVMQGGRLLVGWVSARVKLLDERPQRCYRCLQRGHLRAQCTAEVDRSDTCYRCGQVGHKSRGCSAAPHCSVCAAAGRPAGHQGGSRACNQPKKPRKYLENSKAGDGPRVSSQSANPSNSARAEVPMAMG